MGGGPGHRPAARREARGAGAVAGRRCCSGRRPPAPIGPNGHRCCGGQTRTLTKEQDTRVQETLNSLRVHVCRGVQTRTLMKVLSSTETVE